MSIVEQLTIVSQSAALIFRDSTQVQQLTLHDMHSLQELLSDELMKGGFKQNWDVTEYGKVIETLIDILTNEICRREN